MGRVDRIKDFQFLIFDLRFETRGDATRQIGDQKLKIKNPARPVHPC
jgi:hypothetical protein